MPRNWTRPARTGASLAVTLGALGLMASPALATTVGVTNHRLVVDDRAADNANSITVTAEGGDYVVADAVAITDPTPGCARRDPANPNPNEVVCPSAGIVKLVVYAGPGEDKVRNDTVLRSALDGGPGADTLIGGLGDDNIFGDTGTDTIDGRDGNDSIETKGTLVDSVACGAGTDVATVDDSDIVSPDCEQVSGRPSQGGSDGTTQTTGPGGEPTQVFPKPAPGACDLSNARKGDGRRNRLIGTAAGDVLLGLGGDDRLSGLAGADCLYGGFGNDRLRGGSGNDFVTGEPGDDRVQGNGGKDRLVGGKGRDTISGGARADLVVGGSGNDRIYGGSGNDTIGGSTGNDHIYGGSGKDKLFGGAGRDQLDAVDGRRDVVNCGKGRDVARVDRRDRVRQCERVTRVRK